MPSFDDLLEVDEPAERLAALRAVGVPYSDEMIAERGARRRRPGAPGQRAAGGLVERYGEATQVRAFDGDAERSTEMDALVAYLQILGR